MTQSRKLTLAALALVAVSAPAIAVAQSASPVIIIDQDAAIRGTAAFTSAVTTIESNFKPTIDQINARQAQYEALLKPKIDAFQAKQKLPTTTEAMLRPLAEDIQATRAKASAELSKMNEPLQRAGNYAYAQVASHLDSALKAVMAKSGASVVVVPGATVSYKPDLDKTKDLITELNTEVPSVSVSPPAGWQPGQPLPGAVAPVAKPVPSNGGR